MSLVGAIAQVKLPVTDLQASVLWYERLLGLRQWSEFLEDGVVRGAGLTDHAGQLSLALRDRTVCTGQPDLTGFDVVAFRPASREALDAIVARCEALGVGHRPVVETPHGAILDVPDPDGTVLRFYFYPGTTDGFTGIESRDGQIVGGYDTPWLRQAGG